MLVLEEPVILYLVKMINWHHYPISLKYNPAASRKAVCIQLMSPCTKTYSIHAMHNPLSSHFIMTTMEIDRNNQFNYPVSSREINFQYASTLIKKKAAWFLGSGARKLPPGSGLTADPGASPRASPSV